MLGYTLLHYLINNYPYVCPERGKTKALATSALVGPIVTVLAVDEYGVSV